MSEFRRPIGLKEATELCQKSRKPGDPEYLNQKLGDYADTMPEPTTDPGAPEQILDHVESGGTLIVAVGPHLTEFDQLGVGGSMLRVGLSRVAFSTRTLARAENWYDHGGGEDMELAGAIPVHRRNLKKPRFSDEVVDETRKLLDELVTTSAVEDKQNIMLFVPGTRYRAEDDPAGHGPYENIPIKPGVEDFSNLILQEHHTRNTGGKLALVCMGIYAPESNLYAPPNTYITRPHPLELGPEQEPVKMLDLVRGEVHRATRLARIAAGAITAANR